MKALDGVVCRVGDPVNGVYARSSFSAHRLMLQFLLVLAAGMFSLILGCTCSGRGVVRAEQADADGVGLQNDVKTGEATGKPTPDVLPDILVVPPEVSAPQDAVDAETGKPGDVPVPPDVPVPSDAADIADIKETEMPEIPLPPKDSEVGADGKPPDAVGDGNPPEAIGDGGICPPEEIHLIDDFSGPDFPKSKGFGDNGLWIGLNGFSIKVQDGVLRAEGTVEGPNKWPGLQVHNWGVPALDISGYSGIRFKVRGHIEGGLDGKQMVKVAAFENAGQINADQPAASAVMHITEEWKTVQLDISKLGEIRQFQVLAAIGAIKPGSWLEIDDVELTTNALVDNFSNVGELFTSDNGNELYCPFTGTYWNAYDGNTELSIVDGALLAKVQGFWTGFQIVAGKDISQYSCLRFDIRGSMDGVNPDQAVKVEVYDDGAPDAAPKAFAFVPVSPDWQTIEVDLGFPSKPEVLAKLQFIAAGVAVGGWFQIDNVVLR